MCDQRRLRPACVYAQSDQSLCLSLEYSLTVKLLTEHHLEFLSLKRGCTGSSNSALVEISHCWKSRVMAHISLICFIIFTGNKSENICFNSMKGPLNARRKDDMITLDFPLNPTTKMVKNIHTFRYSTY